MDVQNPTYTPDGEAPYPQFNVSLQNPLPSSGSFIGTAASFVLPPLLGYAAALIGILIMKQIIEAFKK